MTTIDSRPAGDITRRRRMCLNCEHRFTTMEVTVEELYKLKDKEAIIEELLKKAAEVSDKRKGRFGIG